jgi:hypothetical protein
LRHGLSSGVAALWGRGHPRVAKRRGFLNNLGGLLDRRRLMGH